MLIMPLLIECHHVQCYNYSVLQRPVNVYNGRPEEKGQEMCISLS